jgi:Tol biopolymer transport system component
VKKLIFILAVILVLILPILLIISCSTDMAGKIAFIGPYEREEKGKFIYSMNLDGSNQTKLGRMVFSMAQYYNMWSADGRTLAYFDYDNETGESWLCLVDTDGQNRRRLLDITDMKVDNMALSPNGKTVILSLDSTRIHRIETPMGETVHIEITEERDLDLFTVDVKTGELKRLTDTPDVMEKWPAYSPEGKRIAFVGRIDTEREKNIPRDVFVMDADGSNRRHLAHHTEGLGFHFAELRWSPDGSKIIYPYYNFSVSDVEHYTDIFVIDVDKGGYVNLTDSPNIIDDAPSWSPDSKKIAYYSGNLTTGFYTYVTDADGGNKTRLYQSGGPASWTPDGKGLIFTNRLNVYEVMVIDADGKNLRTLARSEGTRISNPIWLSY